MKGLSKALAIGMAIIATTFCTLSAQDHNQRCGHVPYLQHMNDTYPGYFEAVDRTFEDAKAKGEASRLAGRTVVYKIPVVVHIVHVTSNASQNLTDEVIEDQIRVLNEDFRRLNVDAGQLRPEFESIAGDAMIEFELKEVRRVGISFFIIPGFNLYDNIKNSAAGGSDAVDPEHNLNIWVGELFPGIVLGYAYPPAGLPNWPPGSSAPTPDVDGVVIEYRAFGSNNPASSFYENQGITITGRTAVHEVGHYLGLRHIWGDDDCSADDGISDTPTAADNSQTSGCTPATNTCTDTPADLPDMWENYMDYSQETCQVAFTQGQVDVMRGILEGPRFALIDTGTLACTPPVTGTINGTESATEATNETYSVTNSGNTYTWSVTGGTIISGSMTNSIVVTWGSGPSGSVCLTESDGTCDGNNVCKTVAIEAACSIPATGAISGAGEAVVSTSEDYSIPSTTNTIEWTVTGGTITSGAGTNEITVSWGSGSTGEVCVTESDGTCTGNTECQSVVLNMVSGINEISYRKGLVVFPNPATSFIRVKSDEVPQRIELLNVLGASITSLESPGYMNEIDITAYSEKVLLIKVSYADGFALKRVVVK